MTPEKFTAETRAIFDPIANRCRMAFHESYAGSVEYKNNAVRLSIGYDFHRSYELSVSIGMITDQSYDLTDILGMKCVAEADVISRLQISDENDLPHFLRILGGLLAQHAGEFLEGHSDAFKKLAQYCGRRDHRYNLDRKLANVRADAEKAWLARDYDGVLRALELIRSHLTPAELLRLEYAKRRGNKNKS